MFRYTKGSLETNHQLNLLNEQLKGIKKIESKPSNEQIVEAYVKCSGDISRVRNYLTQNTHKKVVTWTPLEDMALTEPDNSLEFQTLLQEKGWQEIVHRRSFLDVMPVFDLETVMPSS